MRQKQEQRQESVLVMQGAAITCQITELSNNGDYYIRLCSNLNPQKW